MVRFIKNVTCIHIVLILRIKFFNTVNVFRSNLIFNPHVETLAKSANDADDGLQYEPVTPVTPLNPA